MRIITSEIPAWVGFLIVFIDFQSEEKKHLCRSTYDTFIG